LLSAIRFHRERFPNDERIPATCEKELHRIKSGEIGESYTTTELAARLGVTSQTIRNWRKKVPGARLVGQRLRFEKSEKLESFVKAKLFPLPAETDKERHLRRKRVRSTNRNQLRFDLPELLSLSE
jgi:transposase-like protein